MRVFVAGATGWIGGAIGAAFRAADHMVSGLARSDDACRMLHDRGIRPISGNIMDDATLRAAAHEADAVIYAASAPDDLTQTALTTLVAALDGTQRPLVFISGSSIYGDTGASGPANEDAPLHTPAPVSWLPKHEQIVRDSANRGVRGVVIRGAGILYGQGGGATPTFWLKDARRHGAARYIGTGTQRWSAGHVDDLAALVRLAVEHPSATGVFNAVAEAVPLHDVAAWVAQAAGIIGGMESVAEADVRGEWSDFFAHLLARNLWLTAARAERELGWLPSAPSFHDDLLHGSYQHA